VLKDDISNYQTLHDEIAHFLGSVLLQPSTSLLDECLIMTAVRAITDDRYDAVLQISL
jgi:hypothetical protein